MQKQSTEEFYKSGHCSCEGSSDNDNTMEGQLAALQAQLEAKTQELATKEQELVLKEQELSDAQTNYAALEEVLKSTKKELSTAKQMRTKAEKRVEQLEAALAAADLPSTMSDDDLIKKACKILEQENATICFIADDGHVFMDRNIATNYGKYYIAQLVNGDEVQLKRPA